MIHVSVCKNIKKIFLENNYCSVEELRVLEEELNEQNSFEYDLTLSNLKALPLGIIEKIVKLKDRITLWVTQRLLWLYLLNLGVKSQYLKNTDLDRFVQKEIEVIVIGGRCGSAAKIVELVGELDYVGVSVFVWVEMENKEEFIRRLREGTKYKVVIASDALLVEKNCVYVCLGVESFLLEKGKMYFCKEDSLNTPSSLSPIDVMFQAVSNYYKERAIAILSCGYGDDGSHSLFQLKHNKTEILLEDPSSCTAQEMLLHAIETNCYSKILTMEKIQHYLKVKLYTSFFLEDEVTRFFEDIYHFYGYDFTNYDKKSLSRRIQKTQATLGINDFSQFKSCVFSNEEVLDQLVRSFSINVTTFFRNPRVFIDLQTIIKEKFASKKFIRIWCAGCSSGQEPYSIAILMDNLGLLDKVQIYATDIDESILVEAQNGIYSTNLQQQYLENYDEASIQKEFSYYFDIKEHYIQVKDFIKEKILFFQHNLATDSTINEFDIVFCRNVLIYFDKILKKRVLSLINDSLYEEGIIVLGESELPLDIHSFKNRGHDTKYKIFSKEER